MTACKQCGSNAKILKIRIGKEVYYRVQCSGCANKTPLHSSLVVVRQYWQAVNTANNGGKVI